MILRRLIAFPESKHILSLHLAAAPFMAVQTGVYMMVPVLLRKHFAATEWQTTLATSALAIMSILAIFWNEAYRRVSARQYLLLLFGLSVLPLAAIALCRGPGMVLALVLVSAAGMGGTNSVNADLLRSCYPPIARNRVFSLLKAAEQLTIMVTAFVVGVWLDRNSGAYKMYFPGAVVVIGIGLYLWYRISQQRLFQERLRVESTLPLWSSLRGAYANMAGALRADERFRRYETAYCIYGLGWMICYGLLPFVLVDVLRLSYSQIALSTQTTLQAVMLVMLVPASYLMDRLGAIRLSAWAFLALVLYPFGLMLAYDTLSLTAVTVVYAVTMAGVNLSWTLGPVSLAPTASLAPQYLAIHATLTSVRAVLGQFPAVWLYKHTGSVALPLALAGGMFAVGAVLMFRLEADMKREQSRSAAPPQSPLLTARLDREGTEPSPSPASA